MEKVKDHIGIKFNSGDPRIHLDEDMPRLLDRAQALELADELRRLAEQLPERPAVRKLNVSGNRFAAKIAAEGAEVLHEDPSAKSLAELPEVDFTCPICDDPPGAHLGDCEEATRRNKR